MDFDKRIPVLVKVLEDMKFSRSYDEPEPDRCESCGGLLFYIMDTYGLVKKRYGYIDTITVVGETDESKKYRRWDVDVVDKNMFCATCGANNYGVGCTEDEPVAKEFDSKQDAKMYEQALDILKYPGTATTKQKMSYEHLIEEVKKLIADKEEMLVNIGKLDKKKDEEIP